jgi:hypothetical protein
MKGLAMTISRQEYLDFWQRDRVHDLTVEELRLICPHISEIDFHALIHHQTITAIALPPVKVKGKYKVVVLNRNEHGFELQWMGIGEKITHVDFATEAIAYAEHMWPEELIEINWVDVQRIDLCNPTLPGLSGEPGYVASLYIALSHTWDDIGADLVYRRIPSLFQGWNDAIYFATTIQAEGEELANEYYQILVYQNCSLCGGGLALTACTGCGFTYRPITNSWDVPLPAKLVSMLEAQGHQFILEPARLWDNNN